MSKLGGLHGLSEQQSFGPYLREVWDRRAFAIIVPRLDIRMQSMDTVLGQFWHIVNPAMMVGVYYLIFGLLLDARRGVDPYIGFLVIGVVFFQLTQRVVQEAAASIARNEGLIRSIQFPRLLLPISVVHGQSFAFVPALGVLVATLLAAGVAPEARWIVIIPVLLAQYLINLGAAFVAALLGNSIRDLDQLLPHLFRLLFYMSGVIFSIRQFVSNEQVQDLFALNPIYDVVSVARWSLMGEPVDHWIVLGLVAWALLLPLVGLVAFRRAEHRFGA
jgi:teichoic acid transport system permease protein